MQSFRLLLVSVALMVAAVVYAEEITSLEELDFEALLKDEVRRKAAFACLMDQAPCGEFQKIRDSLPQLIETKCSQCTPKQKEKFDQINKLLSEQYPEQLKALIAKFSPQSN